MNVPVAAKEISMDAAAALVLAGWQRLREKKTKCGTPVCFAEWKQCLFVFLFCLSAKLLWKVFSLQATSHNPMQKRDLPECFWQKLHPLGKWLKIRFLLNIQLVLSSRACVYLLRLHGRRLLALRGASG